MYIRHRVFRTDVRSVGLSEGYIGIGIEPDTDTHETKSNRYFANSIRVSFSVQYVYIPASTKKEDAKGFSAKRVRYDS